VYDVAVIVNGLPAADAAGNAAATSERTLSAMAANQADKRAERDMIASVQSWADGILPGRNRPANLAAAKTMPGDDVKSMAES